MTIPFEALPLSTQLQALRSSVSGKTFAEAPELFKDVEGIKVRIWTSEKKAKRETVKERAES